MGRIEAINNPSAPTQLPSLRDGEPLPLTMRRKQVLGALGYPVHAVNPLAVPADLLNQQRHPRVNRQARCQLPVLGRNQQCPHASPGQLLSGLGEMFLVAPIEDHRQIATVNRPGTTDQRERRAGLRLGQLRPGGRSLQSQGFGYGSGQQKVDLAQALHLALAHRRVRALTQFKAIHLLHVGTLMNAQAQVEQPCLAVMIREARRWMMIHRRASSKTEVILRYDFQNPSRVCYQPTGSRFHCVLRRRYLRVRSGPRHAMA